MLIHAFVVDLSHEKAPCTPCTTGLPVTCILCAVFFIGVGETEIYFIKNVFWYNIWKSRAFPLVMRLVCEWSWYFSFNLSFSKHARHYWSQDTLGGVSVGH